MELVAANKKTEFSHIIRTSCKVRDKMNFKLNHTSLYLMCMTCLQNTLHNRNEKKGNALLKNKGSRINKKQSIHMTERDDLSAFSMPSTRLYIPDERLEILRECVARKFQYLMGVIAGLCIVRYMKKTHLHHHLIELCLTFLKPLGQLSLSIRWPARKSSVYLERLLTNGCYLMVRQKLPKFN